MGRVPAGGRVGFEFFGGKVLASGGDGFGFVGGDGFAYGAMRASYCRSEMFGLGVSHGIGSGCRRLVGFRHADDVCGFWQG